MFKQQIICHYGMKNECNKVFTIKCTNSVFQIRTEITDNNETKLRVKILL